MNMTDYVIAGIYKLRANGHPNAVPAFGGAVSAMLAISERGDFEKFLDCLESGLSRAGFWGYDQREYARIFCGLCMVDPALLGIQ